MDNYCKQCGKQLDFDSKFCGHCGASLDQESGKTTPDLTMAAESQSNNNSQAHIEMHQNSEKADTNFSDKSVSPDGYTDTFHETFISENQGNLSSKTRDSLNRQKNHKKLIIIGILTTVVAAVTAVLLIFVLKPSENFNGEYALVKCYYEDGYDIDTYNVEQMEYTTDIQRNVIYKLIVKDKSNIRMVDQSGTLFADIVIDYSDMSAQMIYREGKIIDATVTVRDDTITICNDFTVTYVFEKQPLDKFNTLFNGRSHVEGKLTSFTTYDEEKEEIVDYVKYDGAMTLTINSDGTAECIYNDDILFSFTYNPDDMTCTFNYDNDSCDGYITIDNNILKLYVPYERITATFNMN